MSLAEHAPMCQHYQSLDWLQRCLKSVNDWEQGKMHVQHGAKFEMNQGANCNHKKAGSAQPPGSKGGMLPALGEGAVPWDQVPYVVHYNLSFTGYGQL